MSLNADGYIDPLEAGKLVGMAHNGAGHDIVMLVESSGNVVEGESDRVYPDGKKRMEVRGYSCNFHVSIGAGRSARSMFAMNPLFVLRDSDVATASLLSLMQRGASDLRVTLSIFKAGGDTSSRDSSPTHEMVLTGARIFEFGLLTQAGLPSPGEYLAFACLSMTVTSAPQTSTGIRGAVRTVTLTHSESAS